MSALSLTKSYGDLELLFKADIDIMWEELEEKTNGNIDSDNVAQDWAALSQTTLDKDTAFTIGATDSCIIKYASSDDSFGFYHDTTAKNVYFKIDSTTVCTIDESGNFSTTKDIYFYNKSTTFPLSYLIGYAKPVLVYSDSTTINVEQNTTTSSQTLIVFPVGPVAVTENIALTHKFRQLKTSATANGYLSAHTGAADSGMKSGVTLTANTWYFVYAVIVQGGDDAAAGNFILVVDSVNPVPANWSTLDSSYGTGKWVYLGLFRYGAGGAATTTMIPFIQDKAGWHMFTGRAASDNFFGIRVSSDTGIGSTAVSLLTVAISNSGNSVPSNCSMIQIAYRPLVDGDNDMAGRAYVVDSDGNVLYNLPSFSTNLDDEPHGWSLKIPAISGIILKGIYIAGSSDNDWTNTAYISGVLDEWR